MTDPLRVYDVGLQPERTMLAWRRTALSLAVGSAVGIRLTVGEFGPVAIVVGVLGLVLAVASYVVAGRRYSTSHRSLVNTGELPTGGATISLVTASTILLATLGLAWVIWAR